MSVQSGTCTLAGQLYSFYIIEGHRCTCIVIQFACAWSLYKDHSCKGYNHMPGMASVLFKKTTPDYQRFNLHVHWGTAAISVYLSIVCTKKSCMQVCMVPLLQHSTRLWSTYIYKVCETCGYLLDYMIGNSLLYCNMQTIDASLTSQHDCSYRIVYMHMHCGLTDQLCSRPVCVPVLIN